VELEAGNMDRALKHYMIALKGGYADSLKYIQLLYSNGHVIKEDYATALRSYKWPEEGRQFSWASFIQKGDFIIILHS